MYAYIDTKMSQMTYFSLFTILAYFASFIFQKVNPFFDFNFGIYSAILDILPLIVIIFSLSRKYYSAIKMILIYSISQIIFNIICCILHYPINYIMTIVFAFLFIEGMLFFKDIPDHDHIEHQRHTKNKHLIIFCLLLIVSLGFKFYYSFSKQIAFSNMNDTQIIEEYKRELNQVQSSYNRYYTEYQNDPLDDWTEEVKIEFALLDIEEPELFRSNGYWTVTDKKVLFVISPDSYLYDSALYEYIN